MEFKIEKEIIIQLIQSLEHYFTERMKSNERLMKYQMLQESKKPKQIELKN